MAKKGIDFIKNNKSAIIIGLLFFGLGNVTNLIINNYIPIKEEKTIYDNKIGGTNQEKVQELEYIKVFLKYLEFIEKKDTSNAWNIMTDKYKNKYKNEPMCWLYAFLLTHKYNDEKYIIPIGKNKFYILLYFEDLVAKNEIKTLKQFLSKSINEIENDCYGNYIIDYELISCIYNFIDKRFELDANRTSYYREQIKDYMSNMSFKDFVEMDWRFPTDIAEKLNLLPKTQQFATYSDELPSHTMLCEIEMVFEKKQWKVDKFKTIAISRWNYDN